MAAATVKEMVTEMRRVRNEKPNFQVRNSVSGDGVDIYIYDVIDEPGWGISAKEIAERLKEFGQVEQINVYVNSPGGIIVEAMAIYNQFVRHPARVVMHVDGMALSAASAVVMAGDEINIAESALMMIHDPWGLALGTAEDMQQEAEVLTRMKGIIVATYAARTGQDEETISKAMSEETWFNAAEAVDWGLADKITAAKRIAASFDRSWMNRYKHTPEDIESLFAPDGEADKRKGRKMADQTKPNEDEQVLVEPPVEPPVKPPVKPPVEPPVEQAPTEQPAVDRGSVAADVRNECRRFVNMFGAEKGAAWFGEGKVYADCLEQHCKDQAGQIADLTKRLSQVGTGESDPVNFSDGEAGPEGEELAKLTKAFDGNVERAKKVMAARAAKASEQAKK